MLNTRQNAMSEQEFIAHSNETLSTSGIESVLEACEEFYGSGFADSVSGEVESPTGHFYRVHRWIVQTNSEGFTELNTFDSEYEAIKEFEILERDYCAWDGDYFQGQ